MMHTPDWLDEQENVLEKVMEELTQGNIPVTVTNIYIRQTEYTEQQIQDWLDDWQYRD